MVNLTPTSEVDRASTQGHEPSQRTAPKSLTGTRAPACCPSAQQSRRRIDLMLWGSAVLVTLGYIGHLVWGGGSHSAFGHFAAGVFELMNAMWLGIILGILFVGLLDRVPREIVISAVSGRGRMTGLLRATAAGVVFDLCSHGILMVGMKLYERGATIGQTVAFLLASPWNSLSLTVILIALIGWQYTLVFIVLSAVIAICTGWIFDALVDNGRLPGNPNRAGVDDLATQAKFADAFGTWWTSLNFSWGGFADMLLDGLKGSRMVLRWLLFGVVLAAAIRALVPADAFADWFGPTLVGLLVTVVVATVVEVCSEGSAPIAADLITRAGAPGNGFTFLMAGVATDYTEIMSLKDTTRSWKIALFLPLISVPQVVLVGILLNTF